MLKALSDTLAGITAVQVKRVAACPSIRLVSTSAPLYMFEADTREIECPSIRLVSTSAPAGQIGIPQVGAVSVDQVGVDVGS